MQRRPQGDGYRTELSLSQKWICQAFPADRRWRAMAGEHSHIIAQRKQFFPNPIDQQVDISAGQITATNAAREKNIATNEQSVLRRKEAKTAGAMAGHFQNLKIGAEKISVRRFLNQKIWFDWFNFQRESEIAKEIAVRNHRRGECVTSDLAMKLAFNPGNVLDVIDVPVCQQQKFGMNIERADPFARTLRCVEQDPSLPRFEQIAIGFKNPAAKRSVSRRCHSNEVFECSALSIVYFYPTMLILSHRLALRAEFCECLKPLFHQ
jgi:hypothetical protein